jgi:hypothetical protein
MKSSERRSEDLLLWSKNRKKKNNRSTSLAEFRSKS